ncbi:MAG: ATP-binding protein [Caldilinea sp. CFX5]|nr:ATP-binding protein [Caldilinea sp. CFX5]
MFLNRTRELSYFDTRYRRAGAEIAVLYGRRRVGKSALVYEWSKDKRRAFFFAQRLDSATLLKQFSRELALVTQPDDAIPADFSYPDWEAAFRVMGALAQTERLVVVIDEYPYLVEMEPGISTILQKVWDLALQHTKLYLILTGSRLSVMRRHLLAADAPLYRRHTWPYELQPLQVRDLVAFFPQRSPTELIDTFAVLGGMPHYIVSIDRTADLLTNIEQDILSPAGSLFDEPRLQLHEELRGDIEHYLRILGAIANGAHQRSEITTQAGLLDANKTGWYLATLVELGLVEHRQPVSRIPKAQRWGTYHLRDPFFRFWHRWVLPQRNYLTIGQGQRELLDQIRQQMFTIVAPVWEEIARAHLYTVTARGDIPMRIEEAGSWWSRQTQIDVVAVNRAERRVIFGEAKWQRSTVTTEEVNRLINRGLHWLDGDTYWDVHYAFFVREVDSVTESVVNDRRIHIYTADDLFKT